MHEGLKVAGFLMQFIQRDRILTQVLILVDGFKWALE